MDLSKPIRFAYGRDFFEVTPLAYEILGEPAYRVRSTTKRGMFTADLVAFWMIVHCRDTAARYEGRDDAAERYWLTCQAEAEAIAGWKTLWELRQNPVKNHRIGA